MFAENLQTYSIKWITLHQALSLLKCNTLWLMKMWVNRKNWTKSTGLNCAHRISQVVKLKIQFCGNFPFYSMKFLQVHFNNDFSFLLKSKKKIHLLRKHWLIIMCVCFKRFKSLSRLRDICYIERTVDIEMTINCHVQQIKIMEFRIVHFVQQHNKNAVLKVSLWFFYTWFHGDDEICF